VQCHSQTVGDRKRWHGLSKNGQCHSQAVGHRKRCDDTGATHEMCNVTHFLSVIGKIGKDVIRMPSTVTQNVQITHRLLVTGKDVMKLPFTRCAMMSLTDWRKRSDETTFHKMCNVTYWLLVIGNNVMRHHSQNMQCHPLAVGHRKGCDETAIHKMCNVTHKLLVIGKDCDETAVHKMCNVTYSLLVIGKNCD